MKRLTLLLLGLWGLFQFTSCTQSNTNITNAVDYNPYLEHKDQEAKNFVLREIEFWENKWKKAPNQYSYLSLIASNYAKLFDITGNIDFLKKAENYLLQSNQALRYTQAGTVRALARNYIAQHRFKEALQLTNKAFAIGEKLMDTEKLAFDVQMELGNYSEAEKHLKAIQDSKSFDYLIRLAKWNDHLGNLPEALNVMEKAIIIAEKEENKTLQVWAYSNIGDMYGHAGKLEQSYQYYLKTLALDASNTYALKGIAWIVFSAEKNTFEANRIVEKIAKRHDSPDFYLLKAAIAQYEKDANSQMQHWISYLKKIENPNYGAMYNKYNVLIFAEKQKTIAKALTIAQEEVHHRPTPDSYDLLAWSYLKMGNPNKAIQIAEEHVAGKTFEPLANYHLAEIYKANNNINAVVSIKKDLEESLFELGPNMISKVENL